MIEALQMPNATVGENPLRFPVPMADGLGTVTVLCGPNGSGKSFILRALKNMLEGRGASQFGAGHGWRLDLTGDVASHRPHHHTAQMTSVGTLSLGRASKPIAANDLDLKVQVALFGALFRSIARPVGFDAARWNEEPDYRASIIKGIGPEDEEKVYWLKRDVPDFIRLFEDAFGCRVGVRHPQKVVELVFAQPNGISAPFSSWSDGQKSFFTVLAATFALKPDVYIFDEVENFLHPALISRLIEHLKRNCRQTVLSSHHPHLIFGKAIDAVYYVEALTPSQPNFPDKTVKHQRQPFAARRITRLENDRAKLASAYRLFDVRDAALLASATIVEEAVGLSVNEAIRALYECGAMPARPSAYMDRQSEEIAAFVSSFTPLPRRVVDWGAGLGRSLSELSKHSPVAPEDRLEWILYEPDASTRRVLEAKQAPDDLMPMITGDRSDINRVEAGIVLLTNVLHVLDPLQWRDALVDAWDIVRRAQDGIILVTEIYPLLVPEKNAVPVPAAWLAGLFRKLGFKTMVRPFAIQGSYTYCLAASQPPRERPDDDALLAIVVEHWRDLSSHYLDVYEGIGRVRSLADQKDLLNAAFGLARVTSCLGAIARVGAGTEATP